MGSKLGHGLGVLLAAAICAGAADAGAEEDAATRAAARKLAEDGVAALQAGDGAKAVDKLDKAFRTLRVPSIALWSGRALVKHGQLVEAAERLLEATRLPVSGDTTVQEQAKADAAKELEQLRPRIPNLVIRVEGGADVTVSLDGSDVPASLLGEDRPINPGAHQLIGRRGNQQQKQDISITEGERKEVTLRLDTVTTSPAARPPAPATPTSSTSAAGSSGGGSRTLAFVALGLGGAGLVLGGVTGALALSKKSSLDDDTEHCRNDQCVYAVEDDVGSLRTFRNVSTVGFIAGGALAATGVVLLVTQKSPSSTGQRAASQLAFSLGPRSVQMRGSF
jgi:hypothetical protein